MSDYGTRQLRNIALLGHSGSGKSSLLEALLYAAQAIRSRGRVDKGTNHADFTAQEKAHHHSLEPSFLNLDYHHCHINLIDTPGLPDFFGRAMLPLPAVESVLLVINAGQGIEAVTQRAFEEARRQGKAILMVINHIDGHPDKLPELLAQIQQRFGSRCLPVNLPTQNGVADCYFAPEAQSTPLFGNVMECHDALVDVVVEEDDALMELYLEQGENLTEQQLHAPLELALKSGHLVPVCFASAEQDIGIEAILQLMEMLLPNPFEGTHPQLYQGDGESVEVEDLLPDVDAPALAHVFRINIDPYVGKVAALRVIQGKIQNGDKLFVGDERKPIKVNHILRLQGAKQVEVEQAVAGDIVALTKIDALHVDAIVHASHDADDWHPRQLRFPQPLYGLALTPKRRGDEQKIAEVLGKLVSEDPSLQVSHSERDHQMVLSGLGDMHVQVALEKAHDTFHLDMETSEPSVAYRETIQKPAKAKYRHKKQSGGAGQFGEVEIQIEPLARGAGFEFVSKVVGGAVPGPFIPAVEKGVREAMAQGVVAGFPLQDVRVTLLDGKHHSVDSKEIAFVMAGKKAFQEAARLADAVILEPIVELKVTVPQQRLGDITGDLSANRAMVCGTEAKANQKVDINAEAPLATLSDYATRLKSMTGGEGLFEMSFNRYDIVPETVQRDLQQQD
ncbi:elongation factor G [Paraferrimonas sedimenticola]|uniref:Elongation factor G n=1 Tax=Paraferrimonas sedimenticola TaxID=375674 RepID=A0AA37RTB6_9GAMM|nr:elongation factor G [Paraferrimonas sedimenticola]GLP95251.1 elongation factor G [Paraferrimonas sedimenticola]